MRIHFLKFFSKNFFLIFQKYFDCSKCKRILKRKKTAVSSTIIQPKTPIIHHRQQQEQQEPIVTMPKKQNIFKLNETSSLSIFLNTKNEPVSLEHLVILLIDENYQTDSLFRFTFFCINLILYSFFLKIFHLMKNYF